MTTELNDDLNLLLNENNKNASNKRLNIETNFESNQNHNNNNDDGDDLDNNNKNTSDNNNNNSEDNKQTNELFSSFNASNDIFDNDIKNELLELANQVTRAFADQIDYAESCLNDSSGGFAIGFDQNTTTTATATVTTITSNISNNNQSSSNNPNSSHDVNAEQNVKAKFNNDNVGGNDELVELRKSENSHNQIESFDVLLANKNENSNEEISDNQRNKKHLINLDETTTTTTTTTTTANEDHHYYNQFYSNNSNTDTETMSEINKIEDDADFKLPDVDWENLEAKLKEAQLEISKQNKKSSFNNERDEIRRKLAIVSSSSSASSFNDAHIYQPTTNDHIISDYLRRTNLSKPHYLGQNLQICFMNESTNDESIENELLPIDSLDEIGSIDKNSNSSIETTKSSNQNQTTNLSNSSSFTPFTLGPINTFNDLLSEHLRLQNETKQALTKVQNEVKIQMETENKFKRKASPIADIVGLPTYGLRRLEREHIVDMNIGQLQVIANDLCNQIEKINEELKKLLIDRDDLYMQQDSLLVDIEDVTKRIQEYAAKHKKNSHPELSSTSSSSSSESSGKHQPSSSTSSSKLSISTSANAISDKLTSNSNQNSSTTNSSNQKNKLFHLSTLTNKLYRFTKS